MGPERRIVFLFADWLRCAVIRIFHGLAVRKGSIAAVRDSQLTTQADIQVVQVGRGYLSKTNSSI